MAENTPAPAVAEADKPYSSADTAEILKTSIYFAAHPQGELVTRIATQLKKADNEILAAGNRAFQAELRLEKAERQQREMEQTIVALRRERDEARAKIPAPPKDTGDDCI